VTVTAGRIAGDLWGVGPWLGAALLLFAGLTLLEVLNLPGASTSADVSICPTSRSGTGSAQTRSTRWRCETNRACVGVYAATQ